MTALKQLLDDRREVRKLFAALTLARVYANYDKVTETEELLRDLALKDLEIDPIERPGAPEVARVLQAVFAERFRKVEEYEVPSKALSGLGLWADYTPEVQQRIIDLVGPLDVASCINAVC